MALAHLYGDEEHWDAPKYVLPARAVVERLEPHLAAPEDHDATPV